jgi:hypothetical protein
MPRSLFIDEELARQHVEKIKKECGESCENGDDWKLPVDTYQQIITTFGSSRFTNPYGNLKSIFFDETTKSYMKNSEMMSAIKEIKENVLGRKINVVGMDACLMGMFEIAYQMRDYAEYMVASEEVELASGWPYILFLDELAEKSMSPRELVTSIVSSYDAYYKSRKFELFTQAAIDLSKIDSVAKKMADLVKLLLMINDVRLLTLFRSSIRAAYSSSLKLTTKFYVDVKSFYSALKIEIAKVYNREKNKALFQKPTGDDYLVFLKLLLDDIDDIILSLDQTVVAKASGAARKRAGGLSIYFPPAGRVDKSYLDNPFSQNTSWTKFLMHYAV